jgi:cytochrome bd-type quinol oxidase subunit 1
VELFRRAGKLAPIVGVPVSAVNLWLGSHIGSVVTDYQPIKIAASEAAISRLGYRPSSGSAMACPTHT